MSGRGAGRGGARGGGGRGGGGRGGGGRGGGGRGGAGRDGRGGQGKEATGGDGNGNGGTCVRTTEFEDEFDTVRSTRQIKGDEEDEYVAGAATGRDLEGGDDDEEDDNVRRMTKQFAWEEERMEEDFNEAGDKMEPFNLKTERTEGYFDETGHFVWKKEEGGEDPWLASLENEEDLEARIGEAAVARKKKDDEEDEVDEPPEEVDKVLLQDKLLRLMRPGETVLRTLKRLGPGGGAAASVTAAAAAPMAVAAAPIVAAAAGPPKGGKARVMKRKDERTEEEKRQFDLVTELADTLLRAGVVDVYDKQYEVMKTHFMEDEEEEDARRAAAAAAATAAAAGGGEGGRGGGGTSERKKRPASGISSVAAGRGGGGWTMWEYKGPDGLVHGPYSTKEIGQWRSQGFFTGDTAVDMRRVEGGGVRRKEGGREREGERGEKRKRVSFSAESLAADFEEDEEEGEEGMDDGVGKDIKGGMKGGKEGEGEGEWVDSDAIDWASQT